MNFGYADFGMPNTALTSLPGTPADADLGVYALSAFWNAAMPLNPQVPTDWNAFLEVLRRAYFPKDASEAPPGYPKSIYYPNSSDKQLDILCDGMGVGLRAVGFDQAPDKIVSAMNALADLGHGAIPIDQNAYFNAIAKKAEDFTFFEAASFVAIQSAAQVGHGIVQASEALVDTGASILKWKNYIILGSVGFVAFLLYMKFVGFKSKPATLAVDHNPRAKKKVSKAHKGREKIQTILISRDMCKTKQRAIDWVMNRSRYKLKPLEMTAHFWRMRIHDPKLFLKNTFRVIEHREGVSAIVAVPKDPESFAKLQEKADRM